MKRSKFSERQVLGILKAVETGRTVAEVDMVVLVSSAARTTRGQWESGVQSEIQLRPFWEPIFESFGEFGGERSAVSVLYRRQ